MRDIRSNKKINIHKNNPASIGRFKQRSNSTLILDLYDEFSNYVDLSNQEISVRVERPDGITFEQIDNITKNSNVLTVKLKNEVLEVEGKCRVELNLKDSEGQMNTADFFFEVGESVLNDDIVLSSDSYESLEKALVVFRTESNSLMKKLDDNEKVRISNENTRKSQETNRVDAENTRNSKENERISQENTRKSQEEDRKTNENTRKSQENTRQENENIRKSQETSRVNKENERKTNEDARKASESDRQTRFSKLENDGKKLIAEMNTAIDGTITREVTEARGAKTKLGLRLNDMEQQSSQNTTRIEQLEDLTPVWQEHNGQGNLTVNDSFDGITKDLVVRGRTLKNLASKSDFELGILSWSTGQVAANNSFKRSSDFIAIDGEKVISNIPIHIFEYDNDKIFINSNPNLKKTELSLNSNTRFIKICLDIASGDLSTIDLMLIVDNDLPSTYFDSITSCGEQEDNRILLKSIGQNINPGLYETGTINLDTGQNMVSSTTFRSVGYIKVNENLKYYINNRMVIYFYDKNKKFINGQIISSDNFLTPSSCGFIRIRSFVDDNTTDFSKIKFMISEGVKATNYEQFRSKLVEITIPFEGGLKELDTIENNSIMQRVGMQKLNGTEEWFKHSEMDNTILFRTPCEKSMFYGMCDKFKPMSKSTTDEELYYYGDRQAIFIRILKSKLSSLDVTGFKRWLQENNTTVFYDLKEPTIHKIDNIQLNTFDTTTHITQENNILSDISFKAKVSLSSQSKRLREANKELREENIVLKENSARTIEEQEIQDQKITTTMLANTELFEMMLNFMPMQLDSKQFRGGEMNMVEVYVTLIIQGDKTLEQVPTIIRPKVEAKLRLLGVIA